MGICNGGGINQNEKAATLSMRGLVFVVVESAAICHEKIRKILVNFIPVLILPDFTTFYIIFL
jgi:phosphoribosylformimino-5-aminoimidazole carboxamide ribonucleotide (ProFAR) isomerase